MPVLRRLRSALRAPRAKRIFLHIGTPKTGTTFLQGLMAANRENLVEADVLFPGEVWGDQARAVRDVMAMPGDEWQLSRSEGQWRAMSQEMLTHRSRTAVLSMEFLTFADADQARRVVESFPGAEVHVILTVRDAAEVIPAQWQTECTNGVQVPWGRFLKGVRAAVESDRPRAGGPAGIFWKTQGVPEVLDTWVPLVTPRRFHVITVPRRGSDPQVLWKRFAGVIGVAPAVCSEDPPYVNTSLGQASAELVRRINRGAAELGKREYNAVVKRRLARDILGPRAGHEPPIRMHRPGYRVAAQWNARVREAILASGVEVVGDLDELQVAGPGPDVPQRLVPLDPAELVAAADVARAGLEEFRTELLAELEPGDPRRDEAPVSADPAPEEETPEQTAVRELTALVLECGRLV